MAHQKAATSAIAADEILLQTQSQRLGAAGGESSPDEIRESHENLEQACLIYFLFFLFFLLLFDDLYVSICIVCLLSF